MPDSQPLQTDTEPGIVHHVEHDLQAFVRRAQQEALGVFIDHDAGRIAVDAHLVLEPGALQ